MNSIILFIIFFKFGLLAIGGGYVIIPLLYETFVSNNHLFTPQEFGNIISVSQITPGPTSINVATYVGFIQNKIIGAIMATAGFVFPSLILTGIALFLLKKYEKSIFIQGFTKGTRIAAFVMILYSIPLFFNTSVFSKGIFLKDIFKSIANFSLLLPQDFNFNIPEFIFFIICFLILKRGISVTKTIIISALAGYMISFICI